MTADVTPFLAMLTLSVGTVVTLVVFTASVLLVGASVARCIGLTRSFSSYGLITLSGLSVWYCLSFYVGVFGGFNLRTLLIALGLSSTVAVLALRGATNDRRHPETDVSPGTKAATSDPSALPDFVVASLIALSFPLALQVPHHWDDMMYHLPQARSWFEAGKIFTDTAVRYPLFPMAPAALTAWWMSMGSALVGQWSNALAFAAVCALVYSQLKAMAGPWYGVLGVLLWRVLLDSHVLGTAYVDVPLTAMVTACVYSGLEYLKQRREQMLLLSGCFAGAALSMKYQAAIYLFLPCAVLFLCAPTVRWRLGFALAVFLAGGGWYLRSYLVSGDPVHPFGAPVFGFWEWTEQDLKAQFHDLQIRRDLPEPILLLGLLTVGYWRLLDSKQRMTMALAWIWVVLWAMISGYPRYLTPAYPTLIVLSVLFLAFTARWIRGRLMNTSGAVKVWVAGPRSNGPALIAAALFVAWGVVDVYKASHWIYGRPDALEATYRARYPAFALLAETQPDLDRDMRRLYQVALDGQNLLLSSAVIGDFFGTFRLADFADAVQDPDKFDTYVDRHRLAYVVLPRQKDWHRKLEQELREIPSTYELAGNDHAVLFSLARTSSAP